MLSTIKVIKCLFFNVKLPLKFMFKLQLKKFFEYLPRVGVLAKNEF
jgi:hypothetical protein